MTGKIIAIFCIIDDLLLGLNHYEDPQTKMSDAEVMTTAIVASLFFGGNHSMTCWFLSDHNYVPYMLSASRFNRRLHRIKPLFLTLFSICRSTFKELNEESVYILDTIPIEVCDNIRIGRCRIYQDEMYRGYKASKKRYFYGLKIHLLVTKDGIPVEFFLTSGNFSDTKGLEWFDFDLPSGSVIYGDKAYNYYEIEDVLKDAEIYLLPIRKKNSTRKLPPWEVYLQSIHRNMVETAGSNIERLLPKSIHAVTQEGFELKVVLFVLASVINHCLPATA